VRGHLAHTRRDFVGEIIAGPRRLGGERPDLDDPVPAWWLAGHRKDATARPGGRPKGADDSTPRKPHGRNLPACTQFQAAFPTLARQSDPNRSRKSTGRPVRADS
jgi:hypothetical protein